MKLFHLCCFWLFCYFAPLSAGEWWESHFNFWQSLTAFLVLAAVLSCYRTWWALSFACVASCQIAINGYDAIIGLEYSLYNAMQTVLNALEFLLLFGVGGFWELRGIYERHRDAVSTPTRSDSHS